MQFRDRRLGVQGRRQFISSVLGGAAAAVVLPGFSAFAQDGATRVVPHALGDVEVPAVPQRVVTFEATIADMLALDVPLVGTRNFSFQQRCHPELAAEFAGIFDLGGQDLDLEQVINLRPDFIIGTDSDIDIYDNLTRIAPTALYKRSDDIDSKAQWEKFLLYHAMLLGKEEKAKELIANWQARTAHFRSRIVERGLQDITVSIINVNRNNVMSFQTHGGQSGGVLRAAGLKRPPAQDLDAQQTDTISNGGDTERYPVSFERLQEGDADVIYLWGSPSSAPMDDNSQVEAVERNLAALQQDPLWRTLKGVREGRLYQVGGYWDSRSYLAANMILNDLYRGVLQEEPPA